MPRAIISRSAASQTIRFPRTAGHIVAASSAARRIGTMISQMSHNSLTSTPQ